MNEIETEKPINVIMNRPENSKSRTAAERKTHQRGLSAWKIFHSTHYRDPIAIIAYA